MKNIIKIGAACVFSLAVSINTAWAEQTWTVNFKDSDIQEVVKFVADVTGRTMVVDQRVRGRVKVISAKPLNEAELLQLFRTVLEMNDFTMIDVEGITRIIPLKDARSSPIPVLNQGANDKGYITKVIQLKNIAAAKVLPVIRPLIPQHAHLAAYDPSNSIVIADEAENIDRIIDLIERIDKSAMPVTDIVELRYANATDMVQTLTNLDKVDSQNLPQNALRITADKRNNAVLVTGEDVQRQRIKLLISKLDKPKAQTGNVRVVYLNYAKAKTVAETLTKVVQNMSKLAPAGAPEGGGQPAAPIAATVEADESTNALLITASGDALVALLGVVERLDIRKAQVLVEAIIVSMDDGKARQLGVQWMANNVKNGVYGGSGLSDKRGGSATATAGAALSAANARGTNEELGAMKDLAGSVLGFPGQILGVLGTNQNDNFAVLLNALEADSKNNILSKPSLLTTDNTEAKFSVGKKVPFKTGSYSGTGTGNSGSNSSNFQSPFTTIQREDVGITLKVKPHINEGNMILLDISQEVSDVFKDAELGAEDLITNQKKLETQVLAADGETIVMGGMTEDSTNRSEQRVPGLGRIPVLGRLFRSNTRNNTKQNLMIFLRATVIRDDEALRGATAEKYDYIRQQQITQRNNGAFRGEDKSLPVLPELIQPPLRTPVIVTPGASKAGASKLTVPDESAKEE
ncbi:MAG TPA: type II secretion system secretin GspD [Cellvibrionaceae bacterium]